MPGVGENAHINLLSIENEGTVGKNYVWFQGLRYLTLGYVNRTS